MPDISDIKADGLHDISYRALMSRDVEQNAPAKLNENSRDLLGQIRPDGSGGYVVDTAASRPAWRFNVLNLYPPEKGDRCHSIGYNLMTQICCDYLNNPAPNIFIIGNLCAILGTDLQKCYSRYNGALSVSWKLNLSNYELEKNAALSKVIETSKSDPPMNELNGLLAVLNSCLPNLRQPAYPLAKWNQSVKENYDPQDWCYVDDSGMVIADNISLKFTTPQKPQNYFLGKGIKKLIPVNGAFYLTHKIDHYLIFNYVQYISGLTILANLTISSGTDSQGNHYLASSSNSFSRPSPQSPCDKPIYYLKSGSWALF